MSHWGETAAVAAAVAGFAERGERAALATVVAIEGSAYRRPGAKLLVSEAGRTLGAISGGCLEGDVREVAQSVIASGEPRLQVYDSRRHDDIVWGLGLGCNGRVDVFVQPAVPGPWVALADPLAKALAGEEPVALVTDLASGAVELAVGVAARAIPGRVGRFVDALEPPRHLVVCGAGDDAPPLVACAADAGFRVTVLDHRPALVTRERFPAAFRLRIARPESDGLELPLAERAMAVIKMHSYLHDRDWARRLLAAGYPFVGLLGPRDRQERIRAEIGAEGDARLVGPVGLDLGAEGPHQIAVAIVAQLLALESGREPRPLALREAPIHAG